MKHLKLILMALVLSLCCTHSSNAQILKKLKNKVQQASEQAVTDKAAEKVEQETEKQMDSLLNIDPNYESKNQKQLQELLMQNGNSNVAIENTYTFDTNVTYKMNITSNNKQTSMEYSMWFSKDNNYMATKIENIEDEKLKKSNTPLEMFTILDEKNQAMIILMEDQKMAQVISMEKIKNLAENDASTDDNLDITPGIIKKTGKTKKILGYTCEEFSGQTNEGVLSFWVTKDINLYQKNMFSNMSKSLGGNQFNSIPDAAKGFMMETHFENTSAGENKGDKSSMIATKIDKKSLQISTRDYQKMDLSGFMKN